MYWQEKDLCFLFFLPPCTVFARRSMRDTADQVSPNIHQAMTLFDLVLWPFVSLGPQVLPWHILMKFLALAFCYWRWDPCNLRCGCWKGFCPQQQGSAWFLGLKALGFLGRWTAHWILIQVLGSFVDGLSHCMGWGSWDPGGGSCSWDSQLHLHQEDSVVVGEDLVYSLFATPLIVFGALSGLWPLASGLWPLAKGGWYQGLARTIGAGASKSEATL